MQIFSPKSFKLLAAAATAVMIFSAPIAQALSACQQYCVSYAQGQAETQKNIAYGAALNSCAQVPQPYTQQCIAAFQQNVYNYVYNAAYQSCMSGTHCPA